MARQDGVAVGSARIAASSRGAAGAATFWMTTCWPSVRVMCSATSRADTSVAPPGANGTIERDRACRPGPHGRRRATGSAATLSRHRGTFGVEGSSPPLRRDARRLDDRRPARDLALHQRQQRLLTALLLSGCRCRAGPCAYARSRRRAPCRARRSSRSRTASACPRANRSVPGRAWNAGSSRFHGRHVRQRRLVSPRPKQRS